MGALNLAIIFLIIILLLKFKKQLSTAIFGGVLATIILFKISPIVAFQVLFKSATSWSTLSVILVCYLITFLQRMLENRGHLELARTSLDGLFNSKRINASVAPIFIGLLPSPGAIFISGAMVNATCGDYLTKEEKTFVTSFFRHIPESFLPTYSSILIALGIVGTVSAGDFVLAMIPMVFTLAWLGYMFYLRKLPKNPPKTTNEPKGPHIKGLFVSLWSIAAIIILIIGFNMSVYLASGLIIALAIVVNKFTPKELVPFVVSAFEKKIVINTFVIMMFKDIVEYTGAIQELPQLFGRLPILPVIIFGIIFFVGALISGANAIIAMCMPLAFTAFPDGGLPMFVLYMSLVYAAMQLSPTHICLSMAAEYFEVSIGDLIKRTVPVIAIFIVILCGYYMLLTAIL